MSSSWRSAVNALVTDLQRVFGERLESLVVYGPHADNGGGHDPVHCLALVASLSAPDLAACADAWGTWRRHGLATPLILPSHEFHRSLDAFPLEYGEIIRAHVAVLGSDPFAAATVDRGDLRRACETQVKSHLVHLRQAFIETR